MIKLKKAIHRETFSIEGRRKKPVIVSLLPGDVISFRAKGTRTAYEIYLGHCYRLAQIVSMDKMYTQKVKEYKTKKAAGYKCKKPRKPSLPFSKMYFDALK